MPNELSTAYLMALSIAVDRYNRGFVSNGSISEKIISNLNLIHALIKMHHEEDCFFGTRYRAAIDKIKIKASDYELSGSMRKKLLFEVLMDESSSFTQCVVQILESDTIDVHSNLIGVIAYLPAYLREADNRKRLFSEYSDMVAKSEYVYSPVGGTVDILYAKSMRYHDSTRVIGSLSGNLVTFFTPLKLLEGDKPLITSAMANAHKLSQVFPQTKETVLTHVRIKNE